MSLRKILITFAPAIILFALLLVYGQPTRQTIQRDGLQFTVPAIWITDTLVPGAISSDVLPEQILGNIQQMQRAFHDTAVIDWAGLDLRPDGHLILTLWRYMPAAMRPTASDYVSQLGRRLSFIGRPDNSEEDPDLALHRLVFAAETDNYRATQWTVGIDGDAIHYILIAIDVGGGADENSINALLQSLNETSTGPENLTRSRHSRGHRQTA